MSVQAPPTPTGSRGPGSPRGDLGSRIRKALIQRRARANIRRAMDGLVRKRREAFPDPVEQEELRDRAAEIRGRALERLPFLLQQLEARCQKNGIRVHWAENADEARRIVLDVLHRHEGVELIKGKSMVSEEIGLNAFLEANGVDAVETDLGELIVQLADEAPSHIVAPAIHKDRHEVAAVLREEVRDLPETDDIEVLTAAARDLMRARFRSARVGLSGVNMAVAETGTLCLVENEGNGRMCTTAVDTHIAITGVEKVVERLDQLPTLLTLLTRSATGQPITTYVNLINGPRRDGELDGPWEVHLILLDNGRSRAHADPELIDTLRCIRCGACMNHCPVYTRLGGHAYGTVYPGPIGSVLEPQLQGVQVQGELALASSLCGACAEVCPVRIPIPRLLNRLRAERVAPDAAVPGDANETAKKPPPSSLERRIWSLWAAFHADPLRHRLMRTWATRLRWVVGIWLGPWTRSRKPPRLAARSLHELAAREGFDIE